ncbi:hypothetical protein MMC28_004346 [Mycoblastus sanguinarius]|nr:hypothetical protein [Mycoblastus sanguinarius]
MVAIDHCNDCRRATGSALPLWLACPIAFISSSCLLRSSVSTRQNSVDEEVDLGGARGPWLPAAEMFLPGPASSDSFLTFYVSSKGRRRSFCGRCGTNLAYAMFPTPVGYPDMLDVVLGTVDREYLEHEWMVPERMMWWDCGIDWIQKFSSDGAHVPKHPTHKIDEVVETQRIGSQ